MADYINDDDISSEFFDDETVPGANTISSGRNTRFKTRTTNLINGVTGRTSNYTDVASQLLEIGMRLYGQLLDGETPELTEAEENKIIDRFEGTSSTGGVPVIIHDFDDFDLNQNVNG